jgi:hypothetical protein
LPYTHARVGCSKIDSNCGTTVIRHSVISLVSLLPVENPVT